MMESFFNQLDSALNKDEAGPVLLELMTQGGDADIGARIAQQIRLARDYSPREFYFLGMTIVYSAGITILSGFPAQRRYLGKATTLLIHERKLTIDHMTQSPLKAAQKVAAANTREIEHGIDLELQGFKDLVAGSSLPLEEIQQHASTNLYLSAEEALARGLIAGIV